jgi:hypothetical protein
MSRERYLEPATYRRCRIPEGTPVEFRMTCEHDWRRKVTDRDLYFNRYEYEKESLLVFMLLPYFLRVPRRDVEVLSIGASFGG